jgi:hypothetical protein
MLPTPFLQSTPSRFVPYSSMCRCESIKPGSKELPSRSTTRVRGPRRLRISSVVPTARILPPSTATASATSSFGLTVTTSPFTKT